MIGTFSKGGMTSTVTGMDGGGNIRNRAQNAIFNAPGNTAVNPGGRNKPAATVFGSLRGRNAPATRAAIAANNQRNAADARRVGRNRPAATGGRNITGRIQ